MCEMYYTSQPMEMINNHSMLEETFKMISAETQLLCLGLSALGLDLPSTIYDLPFLSQQAKRNILGETRASCSSWIIWFQMRRRRG